MKIIHKNVAGDTVNIVQENWKTTAKQLELSGNSKDAIKVYETALKQRLPDVYIYDRLMILYRKEKAYKKELLLIKNAIEKFTVLLKPNKKSQSGKIASLSKSISHAVGLTDKKGMALYLPQPLARWEKRKQIVKQRFEKTK